MTIKATVHVELRPATTGTYWLHGKYVSHDGAWFGSGYVNVGPYNETTLDATMMNDINTAVKNDLIAHGVTIGGADTVRIVNPPTG